MAKTATALPNTDSGWAVVLGAVIALVSSSLLPWIREAISARRAAKERVSRAIDRSIRDVVHVLTRVSHAYSFTRPDVGALDVEARDAVTTFDLLLDGRSNAVSVTLDQAFADASSKDDRLRTLARSTVPLLLTGWKAGIYDASDVYKNYSEQRTATLGTPTD